MANDEVLRRETAKGDYSTKVFVDAWDEVADLAHSF